MQRVVGGLEHHADGAEGVDDGLDRLEGRPGVLLGQADEAVVHAAASGSRTVAAGAVSVAAHAVAVASAAVHASISATGGSNRIQHRK